VGLGDCHKTVISFKSITNGCSIYKNDTFYVHAPDRDGLYLLDLDCNESHINSVDAKRCKLSDDNTMYLWHCHLGHVGVKRMKKLHKDGLLGSLISIPLIHASHASWEMTKTLFTSLVERATYWEPYIPMCVNRSASVRAMVIVTL
jgi:hypothetical protein